MRKMVLSTIQPQRDQIFAERVFRKDFELEILREEWLKRRRYCFGEDFFLALIAFLKMGENFLVLDFDGRVLIDPSKVDTSCFFLETDTDYEEVDFLKCLIKSWRCLEEFRPFIFSFENEEVKFFWGQVNFPAETLLKNLKDLYKEVGFALLGERSSLLMPLEKFLVVERYCSKLFF